MKKCEDKYCGVMTRDDKKLCAVHELFDFTFKALENRKHENDPHFWDALKRDK